MSHNITWINTNVPPTFVQFTVVNYTAGGETITSSEIYSPAVQTIGAVFFATVPAGSNSLAVPLFPVLVSGKVMLFRFASGTFSEIPTTSNLNALVSALVLIN